MERSINCIKNNDGFALILTILIISLIVVLTLQFNTSMWSNLHSASNFRDGTRLECIARSGLNCALSFLLEDAEKTDFDSLHEGWSDMKDFSSKSDSFFDEGRFVVKILDLSGRIQINQLVDQNGRYNKIQKDFLMRFMSSEQFGLDSKEVDKILDNIKDWIDSDDEPTRFGAESSYYQALEGPYSCKNAPMEFIEELLLVKGITKELFYGTEEKPGISRYLTVYGEGKININTADSLVLKSLSAQIDKEMVGNMVTYRKDEDNSLKDPNWYKKVPEMSHVAIDSSLVTTLSTNFEINSQGSKEAMTAQVTGVVERKGKDLQILSWKVE